MHFYVVALKEIAVITVTKKLSINVLYLAVVPTVSSSGYATTSRFDQGDYQKASVYRRIQDERLVLQFNRAIHFVYSSC
jgi:hypothetical protein